MTSMPSFICPACGATSCHPEDVAQKYCGRCHWWTADPMLAWERPELFAAHGLEPPPSPFPARTCDAVSLHAWDPEGDEDRRAGRFGQEFDRQPTAGRDRVELRTSEVSVSQVHVVLWSGTDAVAWLEPMWLGRPGVDTLTVEGPFEAAVSEVAG